MSRRNRTITSANATLTFTFPGLYPAAQQMQKFGVDDAWSLQAIELAETMMGVDGFMSAGQTPAIKIFGLTLQADSESVDILSYVGRTTELLKEVYYCSGVLALPSIGASFTLTRGVLKKYTPAPSGKKTLTPMQYEFHFESINPSVLA